MSAWQSSMRSSMSSPASKRSLLTAESVTISSANTMGRRWSNTSFSTYFIFSFKGNFMAAKILGTILEPLNSWPWKVQPVPSSQRLVCGLAMSCSKAAQRSQRSLLFSATWSSTCNVCRKLSLWPRPCTTSTPFNWQSCGKMSFNKPLSSNSLKPMEGFGERMILFNSSVTRSIDTILMRSALRLMALNDSGSI